MFYGLLISGVVNLALVLAWAHADEGKKYFARRLEVMQRSRDYWQLRALGKEEWRMKGRAS